MKTSLGLLAGVAVAFTLGCGKSDSEKFADNWCGEVSKCCSQASLPGDGKVCHQWMAFASAGGSYNSKAGDACLAEMRSEISAGTFCTDLGLSACDSVFGSSSSGSKKLGETCDMDSNCAPSSNGTVVCKMGTCTALLAVGATCSFSSDCVPSAFCDYAKNLCTARVAAGATCTGSDSAECVDGYYCATTSKQCTAKVANGASCTTFSMCQSDNCANSICTDNGLSNFGLSLYCGS